MASVLVLDEAKVVLEGVVVLVVTVVLVLKAVALAMAQKEAMAMVVLKKAGWALVLAAKKGLVKVEGSRFQPSPSTFFHQDTHSSLQSGKNLLRQSILFARP